MVDKKRNFLREGQEQNERNDVMREWVRARIAVARDAISAHQILRHFGVNLRQGGDDHEEQFSCPFHGEDTKPSARVYPSDARSGSHVWCFVCNERWDIFALWKKFKGQDDTKFTTLLFQLEKEFALSVPEGPELGSYGERVVPDTREFDELEQNYRTCETRLRHAKHAFAMQGFLVIGSLLDRIRYHLDSRLGDPPALKAQMRQILDKIGEKERQS